MTILTTAAPATQTFDLFQYRAEDGGILDCWHDLYCDQWIYVTGYESWYRWAGTHWAKDERQGIQRQIEALMDAMNKAASDELKALVHNINNVNIMDVMNKAASDDDDDKAERAFLKAMIAATKRSRARVASVETMAQARLAVAAGTLDAGNVLNLRNGTLDLDTIAQRPHNRGDYLTYVLDYDYDPDAVAPRFERFVQEVLVKEDPDENGQWVTDEELCRLFQELVGYSLTNDTRHEVMTWISGDGGNGKNVAIVTLQRLLGPLCCSVDFQTIGMPGNYDLGEIPGRRVIFSTESERGGKVAEGYVKKIVSGERINARAIYGKPFEFKSTAKVWWAMNDKPIIRDTSNSIWRRLKLIPFNRSFTDEDKDVDLLDKLKAELPGILNFALDGLHNLRLRGRFAESGAVTEAIEEYRKESNPVVQWLDERTQPTYTPGTPLSTLANAYYTTSGGALFADYQAWALQNGRQPMNKTNFGRELKRLKVPKKPLTAGNFYAVTILP